MCRKELKSLKKLKKCEKEKVEKVIGRVYREIAIQFQERYSIYKYFFFKRCESFKNSTKRIFFFSFSEEQGTCDYCNIVILKGQKHKCYECRLRNYCSKKCQKEDWKLGHETLCKSISPNVKIFKALNKKIQEYHKKEDGLVKCVEKKLAKNERLMILLTLEETGDVTETWIDECCSFLVNNMLHELLKQESKLPTFSADYKIPGFPCRIQITTYLLSDPFLFEKFKLHSTFFVDFKEKCGIIAIIRMVHEFFRMIYLK